MEEQILELLNNENEALSVYQINDNLGLTTTEEFKELLKCLNNLEESLKVYRTRKDNYMLFNNSHLKIGNMIGNKKGFGFVDIEGPEDVYINHDNMNGAIHGDKVIVEITSKKGFDLEGRIVKIVERKFSTMVGEIYFEKDITKIKLDENKINLELIVDDGKKQGLVDGHKVLIKVGAKIGNNKYKAEVLKIIGHKNDPGVDILSIANKYGINDTFNDEVLEELDDIPTEVSEEEMNNRKDLRQEMIFTIDGSDTKDIDDAISLKELDNGNYELGVHIADVSYYVKEDTALDDEAYNRGTSVYLADRVIPMLPHKLSNGICSLNPNVDRLAISCVMEIDCKGNVINYDIFESVINSKKQMTYSDVNDILERNIITPGYEEFVATLHKMKKLSDILRKNKVDRGYIDFEIDEAKIIVNESGEAIDVTLRNRGVGEKLIEDFMIVANETVATHIFYMELPFVYRVHGEPNEEKLNNFLKFISVLGYKLTGNIRKITPKTMQEILSQLRDKKEFTIISSLLLRTMQKAIYDKENIGHFGLGSNCYTHFTSPIRRYPDTTVHRLLRKYLFKNQINKETINFWDKKLLVLTEHCSQKERDSVECEREVDDMKMAEYMEKHIGESFSGIISGVMPFGFFVQLPNLVEGLVRLDDIEGDYYTYDESTLTLVGRKNKRGYRLGDTVDVVVKSASKEAKTIDFILDIKDNKGNVVE